MAEYKDELFIISHGEMEDLKKYANTLKDALPSEPNTALLTITFLKDIMEDVIGKKVKGIKIKLKEDYKDGM
jgi:hypothetical protein